MLGTAPASRAGEGPRRVSHTGVRVLFSDTLACAVRGSSSRVAPPAGSGWGWPWGVSATLRGPSAWATAGARLLEGLRTCGTAQPMPGAPGRGHSLCGALPWALTTNGHLEPPLYLPSQSWAPRRGVRCQQGQRHLSPPLSQLPAWLRASVSLAWSRAAQSLPLLSCRAVPSRACV